VLRIAPYMGLVGVLGWFLAAVEVFLVISRR
jgi:hypothetical protein